MRYVRKLLYNIYSNDTKGNAGLLSMLSNMFNPQTYMGGAGEDEKSNTLSFSPTTAIADTESDIQTNKTQPMTSTTTDNTDDLGSSLLDDSDVLTTQPQQNPTTDSQQSAMKSQETNMIEPNLQDVILNFQIWMKILC